MSAAKYQFQHAGTQEEESHSKGGVTPVKLVVIVIIFLCIGFLLGFLIAWFSKPSEEVSATTMPVSTSSQATTTPAGSDIPKVEQRRIDCYPEASAGVEKATEDSCRNRGCIWSESPHTGVPWCYIPQPENGNVPFGYKVVAVPSPASSTSHMWYLERQNHWAIYGESIKRLIFHVEYISDSILRFKVIIL